MTWITLLVIDNDSHLIMCVTNEPNIRRSCYISNFKSSIWCYCHKTVNLTTSKPFWKNKNRPNHTGIVSQGRKFWPKKMFLLLLVFGFLLSCWENTPLHYLTWVWGREKKKKKLGLFSFPLIRWVNLTKLRGLVTN